MMPGMAEGSTTRKMVRSLPAPSAKEPSRKVSGTARNASSVVRMTRGRIMIAIVSMPAIRLNPLKSISTKSIIPKMP